MCGVLKTLYIPPIKLQHKADLMDLAQAWIHVKQTSVLLEISNQIKTDADHA